MSKIAAFIDRLFPKNEILRQAVKYLVVGGTCTLLDFSILYILAEWMGMNYIIASVISFLCGVMLNYFACTYWIFHVRIIQKKRYEFLLYVLISLVGLLINTGTIWLLTTYASIYFMYSKLLSTIVTYFWNFLSRKYLLHFKGKTSSLASIKNVKC
jgi:putative flippase GtrA